MYATDQKGPLPGDVFKYLKWGTDPNSPDPCGLCLISITKNQVIMMDKASGFLLPLCPGVRVMVVEELLYSTEQCSVENPLIKNCRGTKVHLLLPSSFSPMYRHCLINMHFKVYRH